MSNKCVSDMFHLNDMPYTAPCSAGEHRCHYLDKSVVKVLYTLQKCQINKRKKEIANISMGSYTYAAHGGKSGSVHPSGFQISLYGRNLSIK